MKNNFSQALKDEVLIFDGAMGTEIYKRHVFVNVCFDNLCISSPSLIEEIYKSYYNAGADVLTTNSFGANSETLHKFGLDNDVEKINFAAASLARKIADSDENRTVYVAGSIGPLIWQEQHNSNSDAKIIDALTLQAKSLMSGGSDFIIFESVGSHRDLELCTLVMNNLPGVDYVLSFSLNSDFTSKAGESLDTLLAPLTADSIKNLVAWGINCSSGPESMLNSVEQVMKKISLPLIVQPNAGLPRKVGGRSLYMSSPEYLGTYAMRYVNLGARAVGGCCGTTPKHIKELVGTVKPVHKVHFQIESSTKEEQALEQEVVPIAERSQLGKKLDNGEWICSVEITPPRGYDLDPIVEKAKICKAAGVDSINLPDGPRASSRMSALVTAIRIKQEAGIEPFLHVCARDRNLIGLQSDMLGAASAGINNVLYITGDPPKLGKYPFASAVFDADAIGMVQMQARLNRGIDLGGESIPKPTRCVIGVGADPNALDLQRELSRFREKVEAGAELVITQPVFDPEALLRFIDEIDADYHIPVIAGVWPLASYNNAIFMKNEVPGVHVPDWIIEKMGQYDKRDDQRKAGIEIARKSLEEIKSVLAGVQVSAPFGNVNTAISVLNN